MSHRQAAFGVHFIAHRDEQFETIDGDGGNQVDVDYMMGHAPSNRDMAAVYRQRVFDERLIKVTDRIHDWLFPGDC